MGRTSVFLPTTVVVDSMLYAIDGESVKAFGLQTPSRPTVDQTIVLGSRPKSLQNVDGRLFVGFVSSFSYLDSLQDRSLEPFSREYPGCNPIVGRDGFCYISLNQDAPCINSLGNTLVLTNLPGNRVSTDNRTPVTDPHGVCVVGDYLVLGEGALGFRVFTIASGQSFSQVARVQNVAAYDVTPTQDGHFVARGDEALYQYSLLGLPGAGPALTAVIPIARR